MKMISKNVYQLMLEKLIHTYNVICFKNIFPCLIKISYPLFYYFSGYVDSRYLKFDRFFTLLCQFRNTSYIFCICKL